MFYRQVCAISPFAPGAQVVSDLRITDKTQRQICVCGTVRSLTVGNHFLVWSDILLGIHFLEVIGGLEESVRIQIVSPLEVHGSRNRTATSGTHKLTRILGV